MFQIEIPDSGLIGAFSAGETLVATITAFVFGYFLNFWLLKFVLTNGFILLLSTV
jgi:undecaprenyl pyrophosphate phosphatase UppP